MARIARHSRWIPLAGLFLGLAAQAGEVEGRVRYTGQVPAATPVEVTQDVKTCSPTQPDESLVIGKEEGLVHAVVYLTDVPAAEADGKASSPADVTLDQVGCRYTPHVSAAQAGAKLIAVNSDPVLHNVRGTAVDTRRPRFNIAMPLKGQKRPLPLEGPGLIQVKCDAGHRWMNAYVHVFAHPYFAVTGKDGTFRISNVPPGTYTLETWHEKLGKKTAQVVVPANGKKSAPLHLVYP